MSVIVPSYAYTYIKIGFLKQIIMPQKERDKLSKVIDIKEFISIIEPYYPDLEIKEYTITEIEKQVYNINIMLIGKIISYSPSNLRSFLKDYLLKYEIMNLKQIISGIILGISQEEKRSNINFLVQRYLDREDFMKELVSIGSLEELRLFLRNTRYYKAVREGLLYFRNKSEIFVLESFLDQIYYQNLVRKRKNLNKLERKMIVLLTHYLTEIYNIKLIYRGILNDIDRNLLSQFLVQSVLFFDAQDFNLLMEQTHIQEFFNLLNSTLKQDPDLKVFYREISATMAHPIWVLERIYQRFYFSKFKLKVDKIDYTTLYRIFELIIKKDQEINFEIIPNLVRIIHRKFKRFEDI
ncbi:MAG: V-type ATP synthase subunit C [Promethearchaeota archaeon]|nr:MAG: V-type ATP synthase subunit C [Candidatus Lokiarchaeota archaeon]